MSSEIWSHVFLIWKIMYLSEQNSCQLRMTQINQTCFSYDLFFSI